jgi:hypothetical protein
MIMKNVSSKAVESTNEIEDAGDGASQAKSF